MMEQFEFNNEFFTVTDSPLDADGRIEIMDTAGCTIRYRSIADFICDAEAEGGADQLGGWEY